MTSGGRCSMSVVFRQGKIYLQMNTLLLLRMWLMKIQVSKKQQICFKKKPDFRGDILVTTKLEDIDILISVRDNGCGIAPEDMKKVMIPFFTTRPTGSGHIGLGLSLVHDIVEGGHDGEIQIDSKQGDYTEIRLLLPLRRPQPESIG